MTDNVNGGQPPHRLHVIDGGLNTMPLAALKVIADTPSRITVQEAELRLRLPVREWQVLLDGYRTQHRIIQYGDGRYLIEHGRQVNGAFDTLADAQLMVAAMLGALS